MLMCQMEMSRPQVLWLQPFFLFTIICSRYPPGRWVLFSGHFRNAPGEKHVRYCVLSVPNPFLLSAIAPIAPT
jgi:hypothetical protein